MPRSRKELEKAVCEEFSQDYAGCTEGPHQAGPFVITRIWTRDTEGEYHVHYAVERGKNLRIFENFSPFATWLAKHFDKDAYFGRRERIIKLVVASIVILVGLALFVFLAAKNTSGDTILNYLLVAIIGGAVATLFGRNVLPRLDQGAVQRQRSPEDSGGPE